MNGSDTVEKPLLKSNRVVEQKSLRSPVLDHGPIVYGYGSFVILIQSGTFSYTP